MKIAICDDENIVCSQIEEIILKYAKVTHRNISISIFSDGNRLCDILEKGEFYDLIFLDIEMSEIDGITAGEIIRNIFDNQVTHIIYISWKEHYCMQLFKLRPTDFLLKPISEDEIIKEINLVEKLMHRNNQIFTYKKGHELIKTPLKNILYFESINKTISIVSTNGTDVFYDKIDNVFNMVQKHRFLRIHQSYVVNYVHIARFGYEKVKMTDGKILPISQSKRKEIRALQIAFEKEDIQ